MRYHLKMAVELALETVIDIKTDDPLDPGMGVVELFRGGQPVANVFLVDVDDRNKADVIFGAISWMRADMAVYSDETWTALQDTNPDTGEEWAEGSLAEYVDQHGEGGAVWAAVLVVGINSAGDVYMQSQAYRALESAPGEFALSLDRFDEISSDEDKEVLAGPIAVMRAGMDKTAETTEALMDILANESSGYSLLEANVVADYYGLRRLVEMGAKCALTTHDPEYAAALQKVTGETMYEDFGEALKALKDL